MEGKGLIYRESDKNDKRSVRVRLTREGKKKKEKARDTVLRFNEAVRAHIPARKLEEFFEVLQGINRIIEKNDVYEKITS
jgi:DNA-binding MarR family transcriptional regulator